VLTDDNWYTSSRVSGGNGYICKICVKKQANERYAQKRELILSQAKKRHQEHKTEQNEYTKTWRKNNPEKVKFLNGQYREINHEELKIYDRTRIAEAKQAVFEHYSNGTLACINPFGIHRIPFTCADAHMLDHIQDNGRIDRKTRKVSGGAFYMAIYREFKKTGIWPEGFQILCGACSLIKETRRKRQKAKTLTKNRIKHKEKFVRHYSNGLMTCADPYDIHKIYDLEPFMEMDGLTGDHIDNDGYLWRKETGLLGGTGMYVWAEKNNWPPIFQILCMSCQRIKDSRNRRIL